MRVSGFERTQFDSSIRTSLRSVTAAVARASVAPTLAALVLGCSDLAPPGDTYESVTGTTQSSLDADAGLPENWRCLADGFPAELPATPTAANYTYTGFIFDYRQGIPFPGASLRACNINDSACAIGVGQGVPVPPRTAATPPGVAVSLAAGFVGYLRLTADQYVTYDYYVGGPMTQNVVATQPFAMVSLTSFGEFALGLGANPAEVGTQGALAVQVLDCNSDPAPGVQLRLTDKDRPTLQNAQLWAAQGGIPVPDEVTDASGIAGFINLPGENIAFEASVANRTFGKRSFRVVANVLTTGTMRPSYVNGL